MEVSAGKKIETIGSDHVTNISVNLVSDQKAPEDWLEQGKEQIQEEIMRKRKARNRWL